MGFTGNGFSDDSIKMIRQYEQYGWEFEMSSKGHAIGKAPDGVSTVSIQRNLNRANRSQQNAESELRRWLRKQKAEQRDTVLLAGPVMREMIEFHPQRVALVATGVALGWAVESMVNGGVRLRREGQTPIVIRKSERPMPRKDFLDTRHRVQKGGDPQLLAMAVAMGEDGWMDYVIDLMEDTEIKHRVALARPKEPNPDDLPGEHLVVTAPSEPATPLVGDVVAREPESGVEVVSRPWMATRAGRFKYPSKAVMEQVLVAADGSEEVVGYACSTCGWGGDGPDVSPHSVASHYRRAHRLGKGRQPQEPTTGVREDYDPSERLIRALQEYLDANIPPHLMTGDVMREVAIYALRWAKTRPDLPEPEPHGPLTDEQIVERIRRLVGGGVSAEEHEALVEHVQEIEDHLLAAEGEVESLTAQLVEMTADRDRLQGEIEAWLALAPRPKQ